MLRRLSVRGKILATLAVPIIVLIAAATIIAGQSVTTALVGRESQLLAESTPAHDILMSAIQDEYTLSLQLANGGDVSDLRLASQRSTTDRSLEVYQEQTSQIQFDRYSAAVQAAWVDAQRGLRGLDRELVDSALADRAEINAEPMVVAVYSAVIQSQEDFYDVVTDAMSDRHVAAYLSLYANTFQLRSALANELRVVTDVVENRTQIAADDYAVTNSVTAIQEVDLVVAQISDVLANLDIRDISVPEMVAGHRATRDAILANRPGAITQEQADSWASVTSDFSNRTAIFQGSVRDRLVTTLTAAATDARTQAFVTGGVAIAAVIISLIIALLIARRIVVPLSRLTAAATQVRDELPTLVEQVAVPGAVPTFTIEPLDVRSKDEIGQLAAVFNDMNDTTIEVAQEQAALRGSIAEMFVNVARRDHTLLNRQLSFLDELERAEEDPTVLSNLFRLDHLATRMRRNSESLLVLAGIDSGRRVRETMALSDVVRTASSEIEAYDRVSLTLLQDPMMLGHHALHSAHLLAELLENATMFSDPSHQIEVTTNADADYVSVAIRDFGLGMTAEEIAEANMKVSSRSASDVVGAQRLGLLVVGRLAEKLDAHVKFEPAPDGGTLVIVAFPAKLFAEFTSAFDGAEPVKAVAPVTRSAADIQGAEEWVPPAPAEEVDLAALTDGTTATGMPRRRGSDGGTDSDLSSSGDLPSRGGSSASGMMTSADFDEEAIVLPELAEPDVSGFGGVAEDSSTWQPLQQAGFEPGGLPTRAGGLPSRDASTGATPVVDEGISDTPLVDTERRASMFSAFRASTDLAEVTGAAEYAQDEAARDDGAAGFAAAETADDEPTATVDESAVPERSAMFSSFRTSTELPLESADTAVPSDDGSGSAGDEPAWVPHFAGEAPSISDEQLGAAQAYAPEFGDQPVNVQGQESSQAVAATVPDVDEQPESAAAPLAAALSDPADTPSGETEQRLVLPRHASPEDLERLMREYGGPEGVAAAITGPVPVVPEADAHDHPESTVDGQIATQPDEVELAAQPYETWQAPAEPIGFADQVEQATGEPPVADVDTVVPVPAQTWDEPTQQGFGDIPGLVPDEPEVTDPTPYDQAGQSAAFDAAQAPYDPAEPQVDAYDSGADQTAAVTPPQPWQPPAPAAADSQPLPDFGSVVAEPPAIDADKAAKPEKRGLFGKLFGKKKSEPATDEATSAQTESAPTPYTPSAPVSDAAGWPAPTEPAADQASTPASAPFIEAEQPQAYTPQFGHDEQDAAAPSQGSYTEPAAAQPAVSEASWGPDGSAAPAGEPDREAGFPSFASQGAFTPKSVEHENEWSPDSFSSSTQDAPRSMSPELAAMLASRADLQDQAFAELSQLSSYRPQEVSADGGSGLVKRKKAAPVAAEPADDDPTKQRITRDAAVLRTRLAAFQSGTSRGRQVGVEPGDTSDPSSEGDSIDAN